MVPAHRTDRVRKAPCPQNPEEDLEAKKRVRRDVEQPEVQRFLRQELLKKVGHSWWNRPRVYRHDLAKEREPEPPVQAVVVIPSEPGPSVPSDRMTLVEPAASPVTSLPCPPGGTSGSSNAGAGDGPA